MIFTFVLLFTLGVTRSLSFYIIWRTKTTAKDWEKLDKNLLKLPFRCAAYSAGVSGGGGADRTSIFA